MNEPYCDVKFAEMPAQFYFGDRAVPTPKEFTAAQVLCESDHNCVMQVVDNGECGDGCTLRIGMVPSLRGDKNIFAEIGIPDAQIEVLAEALATVVRLRAIAAKHEAAHALAR